MQLRELPLLQQITNNCAKCNSLNLQHSDMTLHSELQTSFKHSLNVSISDIKPTFLTSTLRFNAMTLRFNAMTLRSMP